LFPALFSICFLPAKSKWQSDRSLQIHLPVALCHLPSPCWFVVFALPFVNKEFQTANDLVSRNAQPTPQSKLQPRHFSLIAFVIVAKQMEEAMQDKPPDLVQG